MSILVVTNTLQFKNSPVKIYDISTPQARAKAFVHAFMDIYGHGGIDLLVGKVGGDDDWGVSRAVSAFVTLSAVTTFCR